MAVPFADSLLGIGWDAPLPYAATGWLVEMMGWTGFFLLCVALALPGDVVVAEGRTVG